MDRRNFLCSAAPAGAAALWGCRRAAAPAGRPKIRVATSPYLASGSLYLTQERGYFAQAGLDVGLQEFTGTVQAIPLLAGGKVDAACLSLGATVVNAVARGAELRIVAAREAVLPGCGFAGALFARRSLVEGPAGDLGWLRGKRIAIIAKASFAEFSLDMILEQGGLRPDDVETLLLPRQDAATALESGRIDGMINSEVLATGPLNSPAVVMVTTLGSVLPGFQYTFVLFGRALLAGDPDLGVRFLRALARGSREYVAGATPAFMDRLARKSGLDPAFLHGQCRKTCVTDGRIDVPSIERTLDWVARKGYCAQRLEAGKLVDTRFLDRAGEDRTS
jgi:NitT/TauT family transport system substrate-binding protein